MQIQKQKNLKVNWKTPKNFGINVLSKRTKHIIKNKFVYPIMLWDDTAIFIFSNKKERLSVTGFELYRFIALMDISLDFIKHNN